MAPSQPWLLAFDMDGTVIPLDRDPARAREIERLGEALTGPGSVVLAYVTGRDLELALEGIQAHRLPIPDFLAADVGTRVYRRSGETFEPDPAYDTQMSRAVGGVELADVVRVLDGLPGFRPQPDARQGRFKRSYFVPGELSEEGVVGPARDHLRREGARVTLVHSHDPVTGVGLLDVLPAGSAKDTAVRHLAARTGTPLERVVYAGDSGNDLAAFLGGFAGILVGNAPGWLRERLRASGDEPGSGLRIHFSDAPFAAGVLEGLVHFGVVERT